MFDSDINVFFNEMQTLHDQLDVDLTAYKTCVSVGLDDAAIESLGGEEYLRHLHIGKRELDGKSSEAKRAIYTANLWTMIKTGIAWVWKKICEFCNWLMGLITRWITNLRMPSSKAPAATLNAFDKMPDNLMCEGVLVKDSALETIRTLINMIQYINVYTSGLANFASNIDGIMRLQAPYQIRCQSIIKVFEDDKNNPYTKLSCAKSYLYKNISGVQVSPGSSDNKIVLTIAPITALPGITGLHSAGWLSAADVKLLDAERSKLVNILISVSKQVDTAQRAASTIAGTWARMNSMMTTPDLAPLIRAISVYSSCFQAVVLMVGDCLTQCQTLVGSANTQIATFLNNVTVAYDQWRNSEKK